MVRKSVSVHGVVHGVGFRYSARAEARARRVSGWVRNMPDGTVQAELEGDDEAVDAVVEWMRSGPPGASVTSVLVAEQEPQGDDEFRILR